MAAVDLHVMTDQSPGCTIQTLIMVTWHAHFLSCPSGVEHNVWRRSLFNCHPPTGPTSTCVFCSLRSDLDNAV